MITIFVGSLFGNTVGLGSKRRRFAAVLAKTTLFHGDACPKRTSPVRRSSWSSDEGNGQRGWGGRKVGPRVSGLSVGLKILHELEYGGGGQ